MPELFEVETLARDLRAAVLGRTVHRPHPDLPVTPLPPAGEGMGVRGSQRLETSNQRPDHAGAP
jgi:formamidopyrimidine-DNA glycosylase